MSGLSASQMALLYGALGGGAAALAAGIPIGLSKQMLIMDGVGAAAGYVYFTQYGNGSDSSSQMYAAAVGAAAAYALFKFAPTMLL